MRISLLILLIVLLSCSGPSQPKNNSKQNSADTELIPKATDSDVPVDTNDHNKGTESTIALDSPTGPPHKIKAPAK